MPAIRRRWTAADVRELQREDRAWPRYELIDGELLVTPSPGNAHQVAVGELQSLLSAYLEATPIGVVLTSPSDVELTPGTIVQPDVYVMPSDMPFRGAPLERSDLPSLLLAVEILSPSSLRTDRTTKRDFYLGNGVEEYWIVDRDAQVFERWRPEYESPELLRDRIAWSPRGQAELAIDVASWFAKVARKVAMLPEWAR